MVMMNWVSSSYALFLACLAWRETDLSHCRDTPRSPGPLIMEETSANVGGGGGDDERRRDAFLSWTPFFYSIGEATEEEHAV
jgi:hypothetical protein